MKRIITLLLCLLLVFSSLTFSACKKQSVNITYKDAPTIMQLLLDDNLDYGLLPEPAATTLEKVKGKDFTWKRLSLQDLYDGNAKSYPQAVLLVKEEVLNNYPELVREVKVRFSENVSWVENNPVDAVNAIKTNFASSTLNAKVMDSNVIKNCNISWKDAKNCKDYVKNYINNILQANDSQITAPARAITDDFFYVDSGKEGQALENKTFTFYAPDGAPALAIAKFISENENFLSGATFNYNVVVSDDIAKYTNGVLGVADFIVLPVNAASKVYSNQNAKYKMVSVITNGNLFIMAKVKDNNTEIKLQDLNGKKIGVIGKGLVPDLTLKAVLQKNSFDYSIIG